MCIAGVVDAGPAMTDETQPHNNICIPFGSNACTSPVCIPPSCQYSQRCKLTSHGTRLSSRRVRFSMGMNSTTSVTRMEKEIAQVWDQISSARARGNILLCHMR